MTAQFVVAMITTLMQDCRIVDALCNAEREYPQDGDSGKNADGLYRPDLVILCESPKT